MGLKIVVIPVVISVKGLPAALKQLGSIADSLLGIVDKSSYSSKTAKAILLYPFRNRIPFIGLSRAWVKSGSLYTLDWDYADPGQQSANLALRILNGEKTKIFPLQFADKPIYILNQKTAKHMKLEISQELLEGSFKVYK